VLFVRGSTAWLLRAIDRAELQIAGDGEIASDRDLVEARAEASEQRSKAMRFAYWKLDLPALAGALPLDRLPLAVDTAPIAHALIEESCSSARAADSSRTRFVYPATQVSGARRWHRRCT